MRISLITLAAVAALCPTVALADVSERDVQVAARTFGFVSGIPSGDLVIAIVHDPATAGSKAEADQLGGIIGSGLKVAKHTLTAKMVPISALDLAGTNIAFVTSGLGSGQAAAFAAASSAKVMTVTTDFSCVDAKQCVMGVAAEPAVKIQISRSASEATGLEFSQALKLMVTETD